MSYFNLVFASNRESLRLWDGLGFVRVSTLPGAAHLRDIESAVTAYGYYYDLTSIAKNFDPVAHAAAAPKSRLCTDIWCVDELFCSRLHILAYAPFRRLIVSTSEQAEIRVCSAVFAAGLRAHAALCRSQIVTVGEQRKRICPESCCRPARFLRSSK
jgi:hypothetical protein